MNKFEIVFVANSPGELSAMVKPAAEAIQEHTRDTRLTLVLTPCQYASGKENEYIKSIPSIKHVVTAGEYQDWVLKGKKPGIDFKSKGITIYLGGDLAHAILVTKKLGYPAFAYVQDRLAWPKLYKKFFVPDEGTRIRLDKNARLGHKIKVVGNLMVDSVKDLQKWAPEKNVITFLPGSRKWQIEHTTPLYRIIMQMIKREMPQAVFQIVSSPFVSARHIEGARTVSLDEAYNSEIAITIPGTNTARLAALGIPMLCLFPLDNPEVIPLEGLAHYVTRIPVAGPGIKRLLVNRANKRTKYFTLPNIKAQKEIVPEIRGTIDPAAAAMKSIEMILDFEARKKMSHELIQSMGPPGAAKIIAEEINEALWQVA